MIPQHRCLPLDTWKHQTHHAQTQRSSLQVLSHWIPPDLILQMWRSHLHRFVASHHSMISTYKVLLGRSIMGLLIYSRSCNVKLLLPSWNEDNFKAPCSRRKNSICKNYQSLWQAASQCAREFKLRPCVVVDMSDSVTVCCIVQCAQGKKKSKPFFLLAEPDWKKCIRIQCTSTGWLYSFSIIFNHITYSLQWHSLLVCLLTVKTNKQTNNTLFNSLSV